MPSDLSIRPAVASDRATVWGLLKPVFRAGETYAIDPDVSREDALDYWFAERAWLAEAGDVPAGTFYLRRNQPGGGAHLCNCGFVTGAAAQGRGVARAMLDHALAQGRALGFRGMVFNFVVATNIRAVATWERAGFAVVGRVPGAFRTPQGAFIDTLVMHRSL